MGRIKLIIKKIFPKESFFKNVATLMTGTVFSQVLIIAVAPVVTRLYTPNEMGVFTLYTNILGIIAVFECWRYYMAIPLPEKDEDAANILVVCVVAAFFMAILCLVLVAFFRLDLAILLKSPSLSNWLWFMPVSLFSAGVFSALNYWSARQRQFKRMAVRQMTQNSITAVAQIAVKPVFPGISSGGLIGGYVLGQFVATAKLAFQVIGDEGELIKKSFSFNTAKAMMVHYKDFPLYNMPGALLNIGATMVPALLLGMFFGPQVVGFFGLGNRVLALPSSVIGTAVGQAFLPRAAAAQRSGNIAAITQKIYISLVRISFIPMILLMIVAPNLFAFIFGAQWYQAGIFVRYTGFWLFIRFVYAPISLLYNVLERQRDFLVVGAIQMSVFFGVLLYGGMHLSATSTVAILGAAGFLFYFGSSTYILYFAGISVLKTLKLLVIELLYAVPYAAAPIITGMVCDNKILFVIAAILAGIIFLLVEGKKFQENMAA